MSNRRMTRVLRVEVENFMPGNASKSNVRGYAAAGLEASLHNLLTWARLRRVLTSCTWEKTTVAMSKCGSKIGRFVSGTHMPVSVDMVAMRGRGVRRVARSSRCFSSVLVGSHSPDIFQVFLLT